MRCRRPLHLFAVAVAGVGPEHPGQLVDAGGLELALGDAEHRLKVSEVGADGLDFGGQDDLVLVGDDLRVAARQEAAQALDGCADTGYSTDIRITRRKSVRIRQ